MRVFALDIVVGALSSMGCGSDSPTAGAGPNMRLIERFTRTASGTLEYEFTVNDPESFASTWTVSFPFNQDPGPIYEMACHEGNRCMVLMLNGAREQERAEATSR